MSQEPAEDTKTPVEATRITVSLTGRSVKALELLADINGGGKTDNINRAIQIYAYLEYTIENGGEICTRRADGEIERLKIIG